MSIEAWIALGATIGVFLTLATTRIQPYLILMGGVVLLVAIGVFPAETALSGFANSGVITVAALFVVSAGLNQTGAMAWLMHGILGRPKSAFRAAARLCLPVMAGSAFVNNTPIVAMLIPVVLDWAKTIRVSASRLLIPLSYASMLGGMCTILGTSTNVIVNEFYASSGETPFALFEIGKVGLPAGLLGMAFLLAFGLRLLPDRKKSSMPPGGTREYAVEMKISNKSPLIGKGLEEAGLTRLPDILLVEVRRSGIKISPSGTGLRLEANDMLMFAGTADSVATLQKIPGLEPPARESVASPPGGPEKIFAEVVVSRSCSAIGKTLREGRPFGRYGAVPLAISRNGERLCKGFESLPLEPGDVVLLEAEASFIGEHKDSRDFLLATRLPGNGPPSRERAGAALAILAAMAIAAAFGLFSILVASLLAAGAMLALRCCSEDSMRRQVDWRLLIAIAASIGLGKSLETTGAALAIANALLEHGGSNPWMALAVIYFVATLLTELVTNNAAAVAVLPIALATAHQLHVDPKPFAVAVMMAASASFATPLGYQTNLMAYGAGGYRFGDFLRIGIPMNLIMWAVTCFITPFAFPF